LCSEQAKEVVVKSTLIIVAFLIALVPASVGQQDMSALSLSLARSIESKGKHRVAVVDFTDLQGNVTELGRYLAEELSVSLFNNAKGFEVIDRTHLNSIVQEHKLSAKGLIDPATARKLGEIVGADALVTGTLTPLGDSVRLTMKVIDANTGVLVAASVAEIPKIKAIDALLGSQVADVNSHSQNSPNEPNTRPSAEINSISSITDNDFLFVVRSCEHSGSQVKCTGSVTNKGEQPRGLGILIGTFGYFTDLLDDIGNQYHVRKAKLGAEDSPREQTLEPELPMTFMVQFDGVSTNIAHGSLVLRYVIRPGARAYTVALRNLPISQK
jgi:TolB-like protein